MSDKLLNEFIFDARDHLGTAGAHLLDLEKNPGDLDSLNALMGTLHTLKGNSGFLDLQNLYELLHLAESLLQAIREKQADCPQPVIDLLLQVLDTAEAILNRLENDGQDTVDWLDTLTQALKETESHLEGDLVENSGPADYADDGYIADDDYQAWKAEGPEDSLEDSPSDSGPHLEIDPVEIAPGAPSLITLADGDLARAGDNFPARVEALFRAGGIGLVVDLKGLTSLTGRELKLILTASRKTPDRIAFLVDPSAQPDLHRLFQVLDPDQKLNLFPDQESALAHLGRVT